VLQRAAEAARQTTAGDDAGRVAWVAEADLGRLKITEGTPGVIAKAFRRVRENG